MKRLADVAVILWMAMKLMLKLARGWRKGNLTMGGVEIGEKR